jgi:hypothetical protein
MKKKISTITKFSKDLMLQIFLCNWIIKSYLHNSKILAYFKNKMSFQKPNQPGNYYFFQILWEIKKWKNFPPKIIAKLVKFYTRKMEVSQYFVKNKKKHRPQFAICLPQRLPQRV